jgi:hypothetical protein
MTHHKDQNDHCRARDTPQQALTPIARPIHRQSQQSCYQKGDGKVEIEMEQERSGDADKERAQRAPGRKEQIEKRRLGGTLRTQTCGRGMAEETSEKQFHEEEEKHKPQWPSAIGLGQRVRQSGKHHHHNPGDDAPRQPHAKFKGKNQRNEINGQGKDPEKRDGRDVGGEIAGHGAQLHRRAHRQ